MYMNFEQLIDMPLEDFYLKHKGKKYFYVKRKDNPFADYFSWDEFDNYLNQINIGTWDRTPQLQVVLPDGNKWCKKKDPEKKSRKEIFELWNNGCSFVLTLSEFLNKNLWNQCREFEKNYGIGQSNIYCSKRKEAHCFPIHADSTDNFLFHVSGKIRWYIYKEFHRKGEPYRPESATIEEVFELDDGDLLYIPKGQYHKVETLSPRISISFHFTDWSEGKPYKRNNWYNWKP